MARLDPILPQSLSPAQRAIVDDRPDRLRRGPWAIWLRRPEFADPIGQMMNLLRGGGIKVPPRLCELAILIAAQAWKAEYAWWAHAPQAREAGIDPAVLDAIKEGRPPVFGKDDEATVFAFATELLHTHAVTDETYGRALALLGEEALIDLVILLGFYSMISAGLVTFQIDVPQGGRRPLPEVR